MHLWDKDSRNLTDFSTHFSFVIDSQNQSYADGLAFYLAVGGKNLSSQLQNATLKFSGKFQINVIKLIKLDDDMCHPNWHIKICHLSFDP